MGLGIDLSEAIKMAGFNGASMLLNPCGQARVTVWAWVLRADEANNQIAKRIWRSVEPATGVSARSVKLYLVATFSPSVDAIWFGSCGY